MYRHAGIDISVRSEWQGQGLGPDAIRTLARYLIDELGHHRLTIDPAVHNTNAIKAYEEVCEQARSEAFQRMVEHARDRGADAIIAMRYDATEFSSGVTEVLAYGTAVKLREPHGHSEGIQPRGV